MRKGQLQMIAWVLIWVGAILLVGCLLAKLWFHIILPFIPTCVGIIIIGLFFMWWSRNRTE